MVLIQNGFECAYEMNIFINIFFDKNEEGTIITDFTDKKTEIHVKTHIEYCGKSYFGEFTLPFNTSEEKKEIVKKMCGICCVRSFVRASQKIRKIALPWGVLSGIRPAKYVRELKEEGKSKEEISKILKEVFDVREEKISLALRVSENEEKILKNVSKNSVSIYIGIPFCPSRCLYCSFVSTDISLSGRYVDDFVELLLKEIDYTVKILKELSLSVQNIYIGGGTPTTLFPNHLEKIFNKIRENIDISSLSEFTVEAGRPDTVTKEKLLKIKEAGAGRISINPQTLNDETLKIIGRKHSVSDFYKAFELAKGIGFNCINTDLIAGLPGESFEMFKNSVDKIIKLNPENITVHSMCVKRAAALNFKKIPLADSELADKMLSYAQNEILKSGRKPYYMYRQKNISGNLENVGYAKSGYFSQYNINIMEEVQTIIGLGGGGVSKVVKGDRIERIPNFKEPYEYIRRFDEILSKKDAIRKFI